jgi:hypothetical protein
MTLLTWTLSRPVTVKIDAKLKELTGVRYVTSDQHEIKEVRSSAISRNTDDMKKIEQFCTSRFLLDLNSLPLLSLELKNIATGLIAPSNVSVHNAEEIGRTVLISMEKKSPTEVVLRKKDFAVQMPAKPSTGLISSTAVESDVLIQKLV